MLACQHCRYNGNGLYGQSVSRLLGYGDYRSLPLVLVHFPVVIRQALSREYISLIVITELSL